MKKIIGLVLSIGLILSSIISVGAYTDVTETDSNYIAIETLTKIGIFDGYTDGSFKPEQTVTKAEMAKLICSMTGNKNVGASITKFSDVPASYWASGYIANATGTAINGKPDGTFDPEAPVKYEEAIKMIMGTLGYNVIANSDGGYPMGYIAAAVKEKVVNDVTIGKNATRGDIAEMIYNAIDTPLVEQVTWNKDGSGDYIKYDGETKYGGGLTSYKTLMSEYLDIIKAEGVVLNTSYFGLTDSISSIDLEEEPEVTIDVFDNDKYSYDYIPDNFLIADSDALAYVGYAVEFYAYENDYDKWEILSIVKSNTFNKEISFNISDYDEVESADAADNVIYYYKDNATTSTKVTLQIANDTIPKYKVMYNYNSGLDEDNIKAQLEDLKDNCYSGKVTLIDNDKFTGYDAVIIEAAVSDVVDEVKRNTITTKNGIIRLKDDVEDKLIIYIKDNKIITFNEIAEDDVLSVITRGKNSAFTVVEVMSNVIDGTIAASKKSDTSASGSSYKIDGIWYDVAFGCNFDGKVGESGQFYIDKYDKIAYFVNGGMFTGNYGYVLDTHSETDDWGEKVYYAKVLTTQGVKIYKLADKCNIDRETVEANDSILTDIKDTVIDFALSNNKIKKITTSNFEDNFETVNATNGIFDAEDYSIGSLDLDSNTLVFYIDTEDIDESYVGNLDELEDKAYITIAKAYVDDDVENDANIIVLKDAIMSISDASNLGIITDIEVTNNDKDEDILKLTLLINSEEVTYTTTEKVYLEKYTDTLTIGDIVKVRISGRTITAMDIIFDFAENVREKDTEFTYEAKVTLGEDPDHNIATYDAGYVKAQNKNSKKITLENGKDYSIAKSDNVYVIDNTNRVLDIYVGSIGDYEFDDECPKAQADALIIRTYDNDITDVIIIKGTHDYE